MIQIALALAAIWIAWKVYKGYTTSKEELRLQLLIDAAERRGNSAVADALRRAKSLLSTNTHEYVRTLAAIEDHVAMGVQPAAPAGPPPNSEAAANRELMEAGHYLAKACAHREDGMAALHSGNHEQACKEMLDAFVPAAEAARVWLRELRSLVVKFGMVERPSAELLEACRDMLVTGCSEAGRAVTECYLSAASAAKLLGESPPVVQFETLDEIVGIASREVRREGTLAFGRQVRILLQLTEQIVDLTSPVLAGLTTTLVPVDEMRLRLAHAADALVPRLRELRIVHQVLQQLGTDGDSKDDG
jgi:hypothetical protein